MKPLIIDTHVHVYPPDVVQNWARISAREPYFSCLTNGRAHRWADAEDVLRAMDRDGIDESWICGFGFLDLGLCRESNDYALEAASRSGGRLRALCVVPPTARGAADEIARCAALGAIGVGELFPDGQDWAIDEARATWRIAQLCHEHGLFLLLHSAEPVGRAYPGKGRAGPREIYALACNHPELRIVAAHWGGGLFLYEAMPDVRENLKNVYYDTAASPLVYGPEILASAMAVVPEKILYGSDFPLLSLSRFQEMLGARGLHDIGQAARDKILSDNAFLMRRSIETI